MVLASNKSINIEESMDQRFAELLGIIDPASADGFSSRIFEQAPHRWHAANFPLRLTLAEVKTLFYTQPFREVDLRLVKGGDEALECDQLFDQRKFIRPQQAWASIEGGATLVLKNFDSRHPATQELCRGLELLFHHAAIANLYVTPAGYHGLPLHQDYHDVIVCQLEGAKRWQVYERQAIPTENWPSFPPNDAAAGRLLFEHTLVPGDIMYLPRGSHHRATAQEQTSVHVTIGLHAKKWGDLLTGLVAQLTESHEVFRRSLPLGFLDPDWNARAHPAWSEMLALLAAAAPAAVQDDLRRRLLNGAPSLHSRRRMVPNPCCEAESLCKDSASRNSTAPLMEEEGCICRDSPSIFRRRMRSSCRGFSTARNSRSKTCRVP